MSKKPLVIKHDLSNLSAEELNQYLRDVSEFIGLDPDMNALDTIWMQNENGPGQSLVVYARRGTAEILRNLLGIEVVSLTQNTVNGSIIFTAVGHDKSKRQEVAIGSKYINGLQGKALDDAIMTASTRALRRLTMQFTTLGLLDESEVKATVGDTSNPAANAALVGSPMVVPPPPTVVNNAPGRDVTPPPAAGSLNPPVTNVPAMLAHPIVIPPMPATTGRVPTLQEMRDEATRQLAAKTSAVSPAAPVPTPVETPQISETTSAEAAAKPRRARKPKNSVSLEGPEPEVVYSPEAVTEVVQAIMTADSAPIEVPAIPPQFGASAAAVLPPAAPVALPAAANTDFPGKPTTEQMAEYRKKVSVYTSQLPSSENLGSVQKMRAFLTKMSGTAPQFMTVDQWEETLGWFEEFSTRNGIKGLVTYINDTLGVK